MAAQMEQGRQEIPIPVFLKKKRLTPEIKRELQELKNAYEEEKRKMNDAWQATIDVVRERHETNFALTKSKLLNQNQESGASTSVANSRRENTASGTIFTPENRREAVEFYRIWTEELRKNASRQREVVQDSVENWFAFLHRIADVQKEEKEEEVPKPEQSLAHSPVMKLLSACLMVIFVGACVRLVFMDHSLIEYITHLAFKILDLYFKFHDIRNDYSNVSDIIQK